MHRLLAALLGPIFAKEMVEIARRKRYYANRCLYGLALLFSLFMVWESYQWRLHMNRIRGSAELAESMFMAISIVQYIAVYVFVPLFLCGVIASEREEGTLDLLFTTHLTNSQIVLGKLMSRVAVLIFMVLTSLPIISLIQFFGGVDPDSVFRIWSCTLLAMLYVGSTAIYYSAITRSPLGAIVRTYWMLGLWILALPAAIMMPIAASTPGPGHPVARAALTFLLYVNPVGPFIPAIQRPAYDAMVSLIGPWFFPTTFIVPAAWSGWLLWRATARLRLTPTPLALWFRRIQVFQRLRTCVRDWWNRWLWWTPRAVNLLPVRNPLWVRARKARVYDREAHIGRIQWLGWATAFFFLGLTLVFERRAYRDPETAMVFLTPVWLAIAVLTVFVAGCSLVGDRRRGFLDLVLMTPLRPREILDGTYGAIWQHLRRLYWLPWVLGLVFCLIDLIELPRLFYSMTTGTLFFVLLVWHGMACSLTARSIPAALLPAVLFPVIVMIGVVFLIPLFEHSAGPVLWILTGVAWLVFFGLSRRHASAGLVGAYLIAVHLVFVEIATFWTYFERQNMEYPFAAFNPAVLTIAVLEGRRRPMVVHELWYRAMPLYWVALVANVIWLRWWLIRNFERLTERTTLRPVSYRPGLGAQFRKRLLRGIGWKRKPAAAKAPDTVEFRAAPSAEQPTTR